MVSDVAELTRTLRKSASAGNNGSLRFRLRSASEKIKADLNTTGQSIFTDEQGNRYLIQRETGTP